MKDETQAPRVDEIGNMLGAEIMRMAAPLHVHVDHHCFCVAQLSNVLLKVAVPGLVAA